MKEPLILIVDDERTVRQSLKKVLEKEGYEVLEAAEVSEAFSVLKREPVDLIITDFQMPGLTGMELLKKVKQEWSGLDVILITGHGTIERAVDAMRQGAYDFITKPFKRADILRLVSKAIEKKRLVEENLTLRQQLSHSEKDRTRFIGENFKIKSMLRFVDRVAEANSTVLISGESGTGKEVIARLIHAKSARAKHQFVAVNCGAIAENLVESELFGHKKGSFTGAIRDKDGLFKIASSGTLFLDEISTIPMNTQIKLLRVLQENEILPVGDTKALKVDTRIIAASNRDLLKFIEDGEFREDLYYRLNVVEIEIPPLRDRRDDIPHLAAYFVRKFNAEMSKTVTGLSEEVLESFYGYDWKGNVRELENVLERAMILCDSGEIMLHHLPAVFRRISAGAALQTSLKESVAQFEVEQIRQAIEASEGDKKQAAHLLGLSLSSLYRKLTELGIDEK